MRIAIIHPCHQDEYCFDVDYLGASTCADEIALISLQPLFQQATAAGVPYPDLDFRFEGGSVLLTGKGVAPRLEGMTDDDASSFLVHCDVAFVAGLRPVGLAYVSEWLREINPLVEIVLRHSADLPYLGKRPFLPSYTDHDFKVQLWTELYNMVGKKFDLAALNSALPFKGPARIEKTLVVAHVISDFPFEDRSMTRSEYSDYAIQVIRHGYPYRPTIEHEEIAFLLRHGILQETQGGLVPAAHFDKTKQAIARFYSFEAVKQVFALICLDDVKTSVGRIMALPSPMLAGAHDLSQERAA
jgi:hypothetical protein